MYSCIMYEYLYLLVPPTVSIIIISLLKERTSEGAQVGR